VYWGVRWYCDIAAGCRSPPSVLKFVISDFKTEVNMKQRKFEVRVYNTLTGAYENCKVVEKKYHAIRRSGWAIDYNNKRFYKHERQFSGLKGADDGGVENFHEFVSDADDPERLIIAKQDRIALLGAIALLSESELYLIRAIYADEKTLREYAEEIGVTAATIQYRKKQILKKIRALLKE
jgi:RNA polymerase sigma factor (sigma-70 family)